MLVGLSTFARTDFLVSFLKGLLGRGVLVFYIFNRIIIEYDIMRLSTILREYDVIFIT